MLCEKFVEKNWETLAEALLRIRPRGWKCVRSDVENADSHELTEEDLGMRGGTRVHIRWKEEETWAIGRKTCGRQMREVSGKEKCERNTGNERGWRGVE
eukprot:3216161-Pleurochrysis_carterae.AAC.2